jgi:gas vesicle protein
MSEIGGGASRSTDPAAGSSQATDVSLREYLTSLINAAERRSDARFDAMKDMVETAFETAKEAISKAETATDRRLEGMNEFRDTLSDQASHFVTKDALESLVDKLETQINRNRDDLDSLAKRIDVREGQTAGSRLTWGNMAALVATAAAFIGIIVVVANYLSSH